MKDKVKWISQRQMDRNETIRGAPVCTLKGKKDKLFVLVMSSVLIFWMISSYLIISKGIFFRHFFILADPFNLKLAFVQLIICAEIGIALLMVLKVTGFSVSAIKMKITQQTVSYFLIGYLLSSIYPFHFKMRTLANVGFENYR